MPKRRDRLRTTVRAASTDSFMTSPSEPVRVITPLPGIMAASMVSKSPPTSVQAFGNATRAPQDTLVDNQLAVLSYPKATVTIRCNHADPFGGPNRSIAVRGTRGDLEIRPLESGKGILRLDQAREGERFKKGETAFTLDVPKGRYDEEFRDLARVLRGQAFAWSADHDIVVHATALRAAGLEPR